LITIIRVTVNPISAIIINTSTKKNLIFPS
jgi:hypothetical protein